MQPPAGSQVSRVPAQRTPPDQLAPPAPAAGTGSRPAGCAPSSPWSPGCCASALRRGVATAFVLYERAATPDRSAPDVVVDNYLRAFLVDRERIRAELFTCEDQI